VRPKMTCVVNPNHSRCLWSVVETSKEDITQMTSAPLFVAPDRACLGIYR
jgi:hypothetical protein